MSEPIKLREELPPADSMFAVVKNPPRTVVYQQYGKLWRCTEKSWPAYLAEAERKERK